jgi:outer membrane biosynthesis protein TonB
MGSQSMGTRAGGWAPATALALAVHVVVVVLVALLRPFAADPVARAASPPLEIVFAPRPDAPAPTAYTELPESAEETAPDDPKLLGNVASRARDVASGEGDRPRGEASSVPQVELRSDPVTPDPVPRPDAPTSPEKPSTDAIDPAPPAERGGRTQVPEAAPPAVTVPPTSRFEQELRTGGAGMRSVGDEVSLSTTAWEYAPWLQAFREKFEPNWIPPSGWQYGIIHGWTDLLLQIEPDGTVSRLEVLHENGHRALHVASVDAIEATTPLPPLPPGFPEERLIFELRLSYPEHRRPTPRPSVPGGRGR